MPNWFQSLLPKTGDFFSMFEAHAATLVGGADALAVLVEGRTPAEDQIAEINRREHEADDIIRQVLRSVRQTFLTPFDRGAITSLIAAMDNAIDEMQSTARAVALYELQSFEPEMKEMAGMITQSASLISEAIPLLRDLSRNGARIHTITEKVVRLETSADDVHARGLKRAFQQLSDKPMGFIVTSEIYQHLERIADAFEDVANEIDGIVIDHA
jgi:hypothetical protein